MKLKTNFIMATIVLFAGTNFFTGCSGDSIKDSRDGKKYKTVKIGDQTWMAENLNYKTDNSNCYDDSEDNCTKFGRLYSWEDTKKVCPDGWHIPSEQEFQKLLDYTIGNKQSYSLLADNSLWDGKNTYGFSALPAGLKTYDEYAGKGGMTFFWSSSQSSIGFATSLAFVDGISFLSSELTYHKHSIRCIQGNEPEKTLSKFEQKLADDIEYCFKSYKMLQDAFFSESDYFGDFYHIGYVPSQNENFEVEKDDSRLVLKLKGDVGDCRQSNAIWYIQEVATDTGACFNVVRPNNTVCSSLTPDLCKNVASEKKCGQICIPRKNKPKQIVVEEPTSTKDEVDVICDEEECF